MYTYIRIHIHLYLYIFFPNFPIFEIETLEMVAPYGTNIFLEKIAIKILEKIAEKYNVVRQFSKNISVVGCMICVMCCDVCYLVVTVYC